MSKAFDVLVARCRETLTTTPRELCRWLSSCRRFEPELRLFQFASTGQHFEKEHAILESSVAYL